MRLPSVNIQQFYGIEIDDFAHEVAVLSMWLVDHQMNQRFIVEFGVPVPTLPLKPNNGIVLGNALHIDWEKVCSKSLRKYKSDESGESWLDNNDPTEQAEVYIFGNPPYYGSSLQTKEQKSELASVFRECKKYKDLDYISCWFKLAAHYIKGTHVKAAFVSTNSIVQGEQVGMLWKPLFDLNMQIIFAYTSFKWTNNAKYQAGVTCVIICLADNNEICHKKLFHNDTWEEVDYISPYLTRTNVPIIIGRQAELSTVLPPMVYGNKATDGGNLIVNPEDKEKLEQADGQIKKYIRAYIGSEEFIKSKIRYCLWLADLSIEQAYAISSIRNRLENCKEMRLKSAKLPTKKLAITPHLMGEIRHKDTDAIIVPSVSSERRPYIPMGYVDKDTIISNAAFAIYDAEPWVFAIISSAMHMAWVRISCGRLETRIRYSATLCYNTFPLRKLSESEKELLNGSAYNILDIREKHSEMPLGDMYNPESMPADLKQAHEENDRLVDSLYRKKPFFSEEERLECLFALYQQMVEEKK